MNLDNAFIDIHLKWSDWQPRIFKSLLDIKWNLAIHETIVNLKTASFFPELEEYYLYHPKTIGRHEKQNDFYQQIPGANRK